MSPASPNALAAWIAAGILADHVLTWFALRRGAREDGPLARRFIARFGSTRGLLLNGAVNLALLGVLYALHFTPGLWAAAAVVTALVVRGLLVWRGLPRV